MKKLVGAALLALVGAPVVGNGLVDAAPPRAGLVHLASVGSGDGEAGAEIVAYDRTTATMLVTNGARNQVEVWSLADPAAPSFVRAVAMDPYGISVQSVAAHKGRAVAVVAGARSSSVTAPTVLDPGLAVFFDIAAGTVLATVGTGALPDAVTWSDDGRTVVIANEGEPRCVTGPTRTPTSDPMLAENPEGSITIVDLGDNGGGNDSRNFRAIARQVGFAGFNGRMAELQAAGVRVGTWPGSTVAQDLEPEYPTISGKTAYVTLQENNAIATIDLAAGAVVAIRPLGVKDHLLPANVLDPSDRDGDASGGRPSVFRQIAAPVKGMYMPDTIAGLRHRGSTYLLTANEGDTREYFAGIENDEDQPACFADEARVGSLTLDASTFPNATTLRTNAVLGRLKVTSVAPSVKDTSGAYTSLASYGARSMSVWSADGKLVWDSGSRFETLVHAADPANWPNVSGTPPTIPAWATSRYDDRSDDKGPEPEGLAVGSHKGRTYAFVGLERAGGVVVLDVSDPTNPEVLQWVRTAGDISPEGMVFVPASDAPGSQPLLLVAHEISGTTAVYRLSV
jgi:hypothetical protein